MLLIVHSILLLLLLIHVGRTIVDGSDGVGAHQVLLMLLLVLLLMLLLMLLLVLQLLVLVLLHLVLLQLLLLLHLMLMLMLMMLMLLLLLLLLLLIDHQSVQHGRLLGQRRDGLIGGDGRGDRHGSRVLLGHAVVALKVVEVVGAGSRLRAVAGEHVAVAVAVAFLRHDAGPVRRQSFQIFLLGCFRLLFIHLQHHRHHENKLKN